MGTVPGSHLTWFEAGVLAVAVSLLGVILAVVILRPIDVAAPENTTERPEGR